MAAVCRSGGKVPCGLCTACRKAEKNSHPDIRTIERLTDEKGKPKKYISVDQIREVSADAIVLPNESRRKVYIFREGEKMNSEAQNAALKLLEEPPKGVILILCVPNAAVLLPTVRSRCAELTVPVTENQKPSEQETLSEEYLKLASLGDVLKLCRWCEDNNGLSVAEMTEFTQLTAVKLTDMLCGRRDRMGLSQEQLFHLEALMERCMEYLNVNTGVKQLFGLLEVKTVPFGKVEREKREKTEK